LDNHFHTADTVNFNHFFQAGAGDGPKGISTKMEVTGSRSSTGRNSEKMLSAKFFSPCFQIFNNIEFLFNRETCQEQLFAWNYGFSSEALRYQYGLSA
jgi:hypothetical protein